MATGKRIVRPKLFIASASSTIAKSLVEELLKALPKDKVECVPWYNTFDPGESTLGTLIEQSAAVDFAAVLLTQDDKSEKKGKRHVVPRDNIVFELGLFIGALGRDPKRCFMLSSIKQDGALPSDLAGRTYVPISEDPKQRKKTIQTAAKKIMQQVVRLRHFNRMTGSSLSFITAEQLMELEKPRAKGGNLLIEQGAIAVVVNSVEPIDLNPQVALIVLANMKAGAKYEYFFGGDEGNMVRTANLVQTLAMAGLQKFTGQGRGRDDGKIQRRGWEDLRLYASSPEHPFPEEAALAVLCAQRPVVWSRSLLSPPREPGLCEMAGANRGKRCGRGANAVVRHAAQRPLHFPLHKRL